MTIRTEVSDDRLGFLKRLVRMPIMSPVRPRATQIWLWWPRQVESWREFLLSSVIGSRLVSRTTRPGLLRLAGMDIGKCYIQSEIAIVGGTSLTIGDGSWINTRCLFDLRDSVRLGTRVHVGHDVAFITSSHDIAPAAQRAGARFDAPIVIGDGVWIGARATILPGATVGDGCVVAAGALVAGDCAPNGLYAGVPARRVRDLDTGSS